MKVTLTQEIDEHGKSTWEVTASDEGYAFFSETFNSEKEAMEEARELRRMYKPLDGIEINRTRFL